jgi:phospholipase D1/2
VTDPIVESFYKKVFLDVASKNAKTYTELFHDIPSDSVHGFEGLLRRDSIFKNLENDPVRKAKTLEFLATIKGHLVTFPYDFLKEEVLTPTVGSAEGWLSNEIFQ